jgi:hypothetical protein
MRDCPPIRHGTYFASHRKYGWRSVVVVGPNGFRQTRVEVPKMSRRFGLEEFTDWVGPLSDPADMPACQDGGGI